VGAVVTASAWWHPVVLRAWNSDAIKWTVARAIIVGFQEEANERKKLEEQAKEKARQDAEEKAREEAEERAAEAEGVGSAAAATDGTADAAVDGKGSSAEAPVPATADEGRPEMAASTKVVMIDVGSTEEAPPPVDEAEDMDHDGITLSVEQQCSLLLWAAVRTGYANASATLFNTLGGLTPNDVNLHFDLAGTAGIAPADTTSSVTSSDVTFNSSFHAFKALSLLGGVGDGLPAPMQAIVQTLAVPQPPYPEAMCTSLLGPTAPLLGLAARNALLGVVPATETPAETPAELEAGEEEMDMGQGVGVRGLLEASRGGSGTDTEAAGASISDSSTGRTPLHLICARVVLQPSMSAERLVQVKQLLTASPESASVCDSFGRVPIHYAAGLRQPLSAATTRRLASHRPRPAVDGSACHRALMIATDKLVAAAALLDPDAGDGHGPMRKKAKRIKGKKARKAKKAAEEKAKQEAAEMAAAVAAKEAEQGGVGGHVVIMRGLQEQERMDELETSASNGMVALTRSGLGPVGSRPAGEVGDGMTLAEVGGPMVRLMATVVLLLLDHQLGPEDSAAIAQAVAEEEGLVEPATPTAEARAATPGKRGSTGGGTRKGTPAGSRKASGNSGGFALALPNQSEDTLASSWPPTQSPAMWSWAAIRERLFGRQRPFLRWLRCFDPTLLMPEKMRALAPWLPGASEVKALALFGGGQNVMKMTDLIMEGGAAAAEKCRVRMASAAAAASAPPSRPATAAAAAAAEPAAGLASSATDGADAAVPPAAADTANAAPVEAATAATLAKPGEPTAANAAVVPADAATATAGATTDGATAADGGENKGSPDGRLPTPLISSPRVMAPTPIGWTGASEASVLLADLDTKPPREEYGPEWRDYGTVMSELVGWLQQVGTVYPPWRMHWMVQREREEKETRILMAAERRRKRRETAQKKVEERKAKESGERDVGKASGPKRGRRGQAQQEEEDDGDRASREAEMLRLTLRSAVATEGTMLRKGIMAQQMAQEYGLHDGKDETEDDIRQRDRDLHNNLTVAAAVAEAAAAAAAAMMMTTKPEDGEKVEVEIPEELRLVKFEGSPEEAEEAEEPQSLVATGPAPADMAVATVATAGSVLPVATNGYITVVGGAEDVERRVMGGYGADPVHHEHLDPHLPPPEHDGTHGKRAALGGAKDGSVVYSSSPWGPLGPTGGLELPEEATAYGALLRAADLRLLQLLIGGDRERAETLRVKDQLGQLPLHLACAAHDPDPDIIGTLVQVYPQALKVPDNLDRLPVHRVAACPKPSYRAVQVLRLLLRADVDLQYQEIDDAVEVRAQAVVARKEARKQKREDDEKARKELEKDPNTPYMGKKAKAALQAQIQAEQDAQDVREAAIEAQMVEEEEAVRAAVVPWSVTQFDLQSAFPLHLALDKPLGPGNRNAELLAMAVLEAWPAAAEDTDGFDRWKSPPAGESGDDGLGGDEWERCPVTPLNLALLRGASPSLVRALVLAYPPVVGQGDFFKRLPLHYACRANPNLEVVRLLQVVYPIAAKKVDAKRRLPLHLAVDANGGACTPYSRHTLARYYNSGSSSMSGACNAGVAVVRLLLRASRDATKKSEGTRKYYPLSIACVQPNAQAAVVKLLLERDAIGPTEAARRLINDGTGTMAVHQLSEQLYPNEDVLSLMIQAYPRSAKEADSKRWLPLHYACTTNLASGLVRLLLQSNPEAAERKVVFQGTHSCNPLHICVRRPQPPLAVCQLLLEFYPDGAREADASGWLAIHFMCNKPEPEVGVINALLAVMPQVMPLKGSLMLPLHMVCAKPLGPNLVEVIRALLRAHKDGAKVADADGMLPIHLVCAQRKDPATGNAGPNAAAVALLLEAFPKGAATANQHGLLPLHQICAMEEPSVPVAKLLLRAHKGGANQALAGKVLPIHQVCAQKLPNNDLLRLLIEAFPKGVERPDGDGMLALHVLCLTPPLVPSSEAAALLEQVRSLVLLACSFALALTCPLYCHEQLIINQKQTKQIDSTKH
jgi:ankyrin repeat protein